ncbi:CBS domain-containing protein [Streptomyces parvus]|uniref:CBS domain-containing protein n=1 Tax=Streptomyces parvus TaxID=66428 RepID=UPI0027E48280|nr:CBS domain-containing protein [Streptomyces parvus]
MTTAREIMTSSTECAAENETVLDATKKMKDLNVGALPICGTDNKLKGVLTEAEAEDRRIHARSFTIASMAGRIADDPWRNAFSHPRSTRAAARRLAALEADAR